MTEIQTRFCDETDAVIIILYGFGLRPSTDSLTCFIFDNRFFPNSLKGYVVFIRAAIGSKASLRHRLSNMPLGGKGPSVLACLWAQTAVTLTCIVLRWYTRRYIKGKVGADDYVLWVTWVRIYYRVGRRLGAAQTDFVFTKSIKTDQIFRSFSSYLPSHSQFRVLMDLASITPT